jgi:hypothetical protein
VTDFQDDPVVDLDMVESIFGCLLLRWGSMFEARYKGLDPDAVKYDWLRELARLQTWSIRWGLDHLPADFPPTAGQFRELCARAPKPIKPPAIAHDSRSDTQPDKPRLVAILRRWEEIAKERKPRDWIADLQARKDAGETLTFGQLEALKNAMQTPERDASVDAEKLRDQMQETARKVAAYMASHA